ncbi:MAG: choice-of-anchor Q domain-containing protein, partial [Planctomycetia bacterium]
MSLKNRLSRLFGIPSKSNRRSPTCRELCKLSTRRLQCEPLEDRRMLSITLFVDGDAATGGDGLAWATAYDDLQSALTQAATYNTDADTTNDVNQIWIAEGTYYPSAELEPGDARSASFSLLDGVSLYGGFIGTETSLGERDFETHTTTLSGDLGVIDDTSDNAYTVVYCGDTTTATLDGVTITDGNADGSSDDDYSEKLTGGAIHSEANLTIKNSVISNNHADNRGGAIYNTGTLTVMGSTFENNDTLGPGGAISNLQDSTATVIDSLFFGNKAIASSAGAISGLECTLTVIDTVFLENVALRNGGAISVATGPTTIIGSMFIGNSTTGLDMAYGGGGIACYGSEMTVINSLLSENTTNSYGGGIFHTSGNELTVINSTIVDNSAGAGGGGIYSKGYEPVILHNTIVANNTDDPSGSDILSSLNGLGAFTGYYNLIGNGTGQSWLVDGVDGNQVGTVEESIDPMLDSNGFPLYGSPVINAGNNGLIPAGVITDMAGNYRVVYDTVDIGAYEFGSVPLLPGDANLDKTVDASDVTILGGNWQAGVNSSSSATWTMGDFNGDGRVDASDATILGGNWQAEAHIYPLEAWTTIPGTLFVDADASTGGNGLHWSTAYDDLQDALTQATALNTDGDTTNDITQIWIAEGTYYPSAELQPGDVRSASFSLVDSVTLYGGFTGLETTLEARDFTTHTTTLSGDLGVLGDTSDNARTVVYCDMNIEATIDGLTVTDGNADGDRDYSHLERGCGGGIFNDGHLTLLNSKVIENSANLDGGGIYSHYYTMTIANSIMAGNSAENGGAAYVQGNILTVTNSTITDNSTSNGSALWVYSYGGINLHNSIVWQNEGDTVGGGEIYGNHNLIGIDPLFVDPSTGDYRLQANSPAIHYGDNDLAVDGENNPLVIDADGNARIYGTTVDCGAFEYQSEIAPGRETPSLTVTTDSDVFDLYDGQITLREAIYYADSDTLGTTVTFDPTLDGATIILDGTALSIDKTLTIDASSLTSLTIDANGQSQVLSVIANDTDEALVNSLTITGGVGYNGGGIYTNSHLTITDSVITDNSAFDGGGLYAASGSYLTIIRSILSDNIAGSDGGGILNRSDTTILNSIIAGNSAFDGGGLYNANDNPLIITNSTITGNTADNAGGIYNNGDTLTINNSILSQNTGGELDGWESISLSNNLIGIDPQFVDPGNGDYRLQATSPAINYGNNDLAIDRNGDPLAVDADGNARIYDTTVDCGAFEFQGATAPGREAPALVVTSTGDFVNLYDGQITLREAIYYADPATPGTTITFDPLLDAATITLSGSSLLIDKSLTIDASSLTSLTIDAVGQSRVITVVGSQESEVTLSGLTITGGASGSGGGIYSSGGNLTIVDSTVTGNTTTILAGGIYSNGNLTIVNSAITDNTSNTDG